MNKRFSINLLFLYLILSIGFVNVEAQPANTGSGNFWKCTVFDQDQNQWVGKGEFERIATNKAYDACKKQSKFPQSCKAAKENCEGIVSGRSTRTMWQCTALDDMAKPWKGAFYVHADDAAIGAKAFCKDKSALPDTCYINLLSCNNIN